VGRLLTEILEGRLRPGQRLVVQSLDETFGLGRMPIREALLVLAGIGVVEARPNRGAIVRGLRPAEVRGIYLVRRALECEAVRTARGRIAIDELQAIHAELSSLLAAGAADRAVSVGKARAVDNRLHDLIAASCGNPFLRDELERLKLLYRFFRDFAFGQEGPFNNYFRKDKEAQEHLAIVEALLAEDFRLARRAMSLHILSALRYFEDLTRHIQAEKGVDGWSAPWTPTTSVDGS
jgi:DNA-binding GntR family transcriptional regulator